MKRKKAVPEGLTTNAVAPSLRSVFRDGITAELPEVPLKVTTPA
jgi:hypothetical protein